MLYEKVRQRGNFMDENTKKSELTETEQIPKKREIYEWLQSIVVALIVCVLMFSFVVRLVDVLGSSMYPTLEEGDKIIVSGLFYSPKQGDIVVLQKDSYGDDALVKRIIATEGQTVRIDFDAGVVYVDGEALDEPYTAEPTYERINFSGEVTVPENSVFVMGDNRNHSTDSRDFRIGFVDERNIMGKVYFTVFPLKNFGSDYS